MKHNGELSIAKKLIDIAVEAKIDAVKFQTFNPDSLLLKNTPKVEYQKTSNENGENFFDLVKKYELSKQEFKILKDYCTEKDIIFLSTPFDELSVELLEGLNVSAFKVGSGDMNNFPLLKLICSKGKPIFLSTGMASLEEVKESVEFIKNNGIKDLVLFQCTTNYPSNYNEINLNVIETFRKEFPNLIFGFSDHSPGFEASIGAVVKGVKVIEKHITLDKEMEGPDHKASLNPEELMEWVRAIRNIEQALGKYEKIPSNNEIEIAQVVRKSVVTLNDLRKGDIIKREDVGIKRPGTGILPKLYEEVIGKRVKTDISRESVLNWEDIE